MTNKPTDKRDTRRALTLRVLLTDEPSQANPEERRIDLIAYSPAINRRVCERRAYDNDLADANEVTWIRMVARREAAQALGLQILAMLDDMPDEESHND